MTPKPTDRPDRTIAIKHLEERWIEKQAKKKTLPPQTTTSTPPESEKPKK